MLTRTPNAGNRSKKLYRYLELQALSIAFVLLCCHQKPRIYEHSGFCKTHYAARWSLFTQQKATDDFVRFVKPRRDGADIRTSTDREEQKHWIVAWLILCFVVTCLLPNASLAADRKIAPPTCPSFPYKCKAREGQGALQNAEGLLQAARQDLAAAEKLAGGVFTPGDSPPGLAEVREFWNDEVQRLKLNRQYLETLRSQLSSSTSTRAVAEDTLPVRLISRLVIRAKDVMQEAKFWCEGVGMQKYSDLQHGGVLVAFGPPGIAQGDEGGFFALEIRPWGEAVAARQPGLSDDDDPKLSFVQLALPNQVRPFKVLEAGGEVNDSSGYFQLKSPAGICVRAYIDDRRDPVEFVALAVNSGKPYDEMSKDLLDMGLRANGRYRRRSPVTQSDMPSLPEPNQLYGSGDPALSAQLLLLPFRPEGLVSYEMPRTLKKSDANPSFLSWLVPQAVTSQDESLIVKEKPYSPLSSIDHADIVAYGPSRQGVMWKSNSSARRIVALDLQTIDKVELSRT